MAERRARRIWAEFCLRHLNTWINIKRKNPGFLVDLEEVTQNIRDLRYTTEGAVVRDLPLMQNVATQTEPADAQTRAIQAEPARESRDTQTGESAAPTAQSGPEPTRERPVPAPIRPGCWNCDGAHPYTWCPQFRRLFCYGCGERGVTLRECRRYESNYRAEGPYRGVRGPRDRSTSRDRCGGDEVDEPGYGRWETPEVE